MGCVFPLVYTDFMISRPTTVEAMAMCMCLCSRRVGVCGNSLMR